MDDQKSRMVMKKDGANGRDSYCRSSHLTSEVSSTTSVTSICSFDASLFSILSQQQQEPQQEQQHHTSELETESVVAVDSSRKELQTCIEEDDDDYDDNSKDWIQIPIGESGEEIQSEDADRDTDTTVSLLVEGPSSMSAAASFLEVMAAASLRTYEEEGEDFQTAMSSSIACFEEDDESASSVVVPLDGVSRRDDNQDAVPLVVDVFWDSDGSDPHNIDNNSEMVLLPTSTSRTSHSQEMEKGNEITRGRGAWWRPPVETWKDTTPFSEVQSTSIFQPNHKALYSGTYTTNNSHSIVLFRDLEHFHPLGLGRPFIEAKSRADPVERPVELNVTVPLDLPFGLINSIGSYSQRFSMINHDICTVIADQTDKLESNSTLPIHAMKGTRSVNSIGSTSQRFPMINHDMCTVIADQTEKLENNSTLPIHAMKGTRSMNSIGSTSQRFPMINHDMCTVIADQTEKLENNSRLPIRPMKGTRSMNSIGSTSQRFPMINHDMCTVIADQTEKLENNSTLPIHAMKGTRSMNSIGSTYQRFPMINHDMCTVIADQTEKLENNSTLPIHAMKGTRSMNSIGSSSQRFPMINHDMCTVIADQTEKLENKSTLPIRPMKGTRSMNSIGSSSQRFPMINHDMCTVIADQTEKLENKSTLPIRPMKGTRSMNSIGSSSQRFPMINHDICTVSGDQKKELENNSTLPIRPMKGTRTPISDNRLRPELWTKSGHFSLAGNLILSIRVAMTAGTNVWRKSIARDLQIRAERAKKRQSRYSPRITKKEAEHRIPQDAIGVLATQVHRHGTLQIERVRRFISDMVLILNDHRQRRRSRRHRHAVQMHRLRASTHR
ncbi:hypothetical protein IV203_030210 [Nitzschia inconspicua]|uniref:Uncharacterized protein n=1 Tax=Nitzschia inconspicua TaxID=303405 RepID=A0A9K3LT90_9STRA|nr:hypothetical protein IV203_030210 [Nitzschia inconspicua]